MTEAEELGRLREKVTELEAQLAAAKSAERPAPERPASAGVRTRWRSVTAGALIVVACLLAPFSVTAVWADSQVSDTDAYVETVSPLVQDPTIQSAIADEVTQEIFNNIDVEKVTSDALAAIAERGDLPPRAAAGLPALQVPIVNGIESFTRTEVGKIVASPEFATVWDQANRAAHAQLVNLLSGEQGGAVSAQNGTVTLNLAPMIAQVKQRLVAEGYTIANNIPTVNKSFVLVRSDAITKAQRGYRLLDTLGTWLPIIALVLFGLGVYAARGHRRALMLGALGVVGAMLALGVTLAVARVLYLDAVPTDVLSPAAAGDIFDTLVQFLRNGLRATAVLALFVALGAFFTGPTAAASRTRATLAKGIGSLRGSAESRGLATGPVGAWTFAHRRPLRLGVVVAGGLVLTFWSRPTVAVVIVTAVLVLLAIGLIELIGRPPTEGAPEVMGEDQEQALPRQREPVIPAGTQTSVPADGEAPYEGEKESTPHG